MAKIIGLDIGLKRIGVAFSDGKITVPLNPIIRKNRNQAANEVREVLSEYKADTLVIGVPLGGGSEDEMKRRVEHFASLLDFHGKLEYVNEAYSSSEASDLYTSSKRDGRLDSMSAMIILNRYLKL
ncbi:Holliday junction resolvase RuvX [Campylobacter sp. 19-13652]|uniref:Holliday junction resolvase RuvX n=1 Tax=Campylobacter sp. 19-13652 TaxID=2840180 RepID=UPI001C772F5D|nr:Holliday junction resolvase RuvX [Campylobacter sp. 19-13652]BCX79508.1 putative pre-16S rRNA nuclease [Campylobacter sp. 19-13652]